MGDNQENSRTFNSYRYYMNSYLITNMEVSVYIFCILMLVINALRYLYLINLSVQLESASLNDLEEGTYLCSTILYYLVFEVIPLANLVAIILFICTLLYSIRRAIMKRKMIRSLIRSEQLYYNNKMELKRQRANYLNSYIQKEN